MSQTVVRVIIQEFKDQDHYDKSMGHSFGQVGITKSNVTETFRGTVEEFWELLGTHGDPLVVEDLNT